MKTFLINLVLFSAAAVSAIPFIWLIHSSLPLDSFSEVVHRRPFWEWMLNSVFLASAQTVAVVLISSLAGFAMAKYQFAGRRTILALLLATFLLPPQVLLPSLYELIRGFGWVNSYWAILAPGCVSVVGVILYRQAMRDVPDEMIHAARLDGCGEWRIWWNIALPLVRPMTGALALLTFLASWNGYLWPQIVLQDERRFTLPIGLANMTTLPEFQSHFSILMAGTLLSLLPVAVLFFALQDDFLSGISQATVSD